MEKPSINGGKSIIVQRKRRIEVTIHPESPWLYGAAPGLRGRKRAGASTCIFELLAPERDGQSRRGAPHAAVPSLKASNRERERFVKTNKNLLSSLFPTVARGDVQ